MTSVFVMGRTGERAASRGFTLIELLISVAILAMLAGGAMTFADLAVKRTKEQELRVALRQIREGIDAYKKAADANRIAKASDESGYPRTLEELTQGVPLANDPKGGKLYFMRRLPRDPMAEPTGAPESTWGLRSYESGPDNPQQGKDVFDVYSLSNRNGLDGRAYRQW